MTLNMVQIEPLLTELCALQVIVPCLRVGLSLKVVNIIDLIVAAIADSGLIMLSYTKFDWQSAGFPW